MHKWESPENVLAYVVSVGRWSFGSGVFLGFIAGVSLGLAAPHFQTPPWMKVESKGGRGPVGDTGVVPPLPPEGDVGVRQPRTEG